MGLAGVEPAYCYDAVSILMDSCMFTAYAATPLKLVELQCRVPHILCPEDLLIEAPLKSCQLTRYVRIAGARAGLRDQRGSHHATGSLVTPRFP